MHGYERLGLHVSASFDLPTDRSCGVRAITISVNVPYELPKSRRAALQAVVQHCDVHNTLSKPPEVRIDLTGQPGSLRAPHRAGLRARLATAKLA